MAENLQKDDMEPPRKSVKLDPTTALSSTTEEEITEKDLPLLANVEDVSVIHYLMKFKTNLVDKIVTATSILFLEWKESCIKVPQKVVLDSCYLKVKNVYSLKTVAEYQVTDALKRHNEAGSRKHFYRSGFDWFGATDRGEPNIFNEALQFSVEKWSVTISGWRDLPSVILIDYETLPNSPSLDWRPCNGYTYDANDIENICLYTPAMPVNNRGLFPCQEPPSALATWEVLMEVENSLIPLLTSDEPGEIIGGGDKTAIFYFYTSIPLPLSTFAVVIGNFVLQMDLTPTITENEKKTKGERTGTFVNPSTCDNHSPYPCRFGGEKSIREKHLPVKLYSLDKTCLEGLDFKKLANFVHVSLQTCHENFGPHPFPRLDLVIMPFCYPHMGLASPSMIFLSPSNFSGDSGDKENEPLYVCRIPHEICHSWFGLLIGALDWTEEWLSEGFCTYCEDVVFFDTYRSFFPYKSDEEIRKIQSLKICQRFITLQNELRNTDEELHVMSRESEDTRKAKNGLEPIKQFMHVHYYKGYLLLCFMAHLVGQQNFVRFLKQYVSRYHAQLVSSDIFLQYYYEKFRDELSSNEKFESVERLKKDWLEMKKLPGPLDTLDLLDMDFIATVSISEADIYQLVPLAQIKILMSASLLIYRSVESGQLFAELLRRLNSSELTLFLESALRKMEVSRKSGKMLYKKLAESKVFSDDIHLHNPEIVHRWCELIILNRDKGRVNVVEEFLLRHMAMGTYLYGELMISEKLSFQKLAKRVYRKLEGLYDLGTRRLLKEMLF